MNIDYINYNVRLRKLSCHRSIESSKKFYVMFYSDLPRRRDLKGQDIGPWRFVKWWREDLTFWLTRSICRFWDDTSFPMSMAMLRRLPTMPLTSLMFCSISSSRASFVILKVVVSRARLIRVGRICKVHRFHLIFYSFFLQASIRAVYFMPIVYVGREI